VDARQRQITRSRFRMTPAACWMQALYADVLQRVQPRSCIPEIDYPYGENRN